MANIERDYLRTSGLNDVELAMRFYDDFSNGQLFFGTVIANEDFNEWIASLNFPFIDHGWDTIEGRKAWGGYRSSIRGYLKSGVMDEEYGLKTESGRYEPYVVEINQFGVDLKIVEYSDHVVETAKELAGKRQKTIKRQSKDIKKGFTTMIDVYGAKGMEIQVQQKLVDSQNEMRLHIEKAFDEIYRKTVTETANLIAESRNVIKRITEEASNIDNKAEDESAIKQLTEQPLTVDEEEEEEVSA